METLTGISVILLILFILLVVPALFAYGASNSDGGHWITLGLGYLKKNGLAKLNRCLLPLSFYLALYITIVPSTLNDQSMLGAGFCAALLSFYLSRSLREIYRESKLDLILTIVLVISVIVLFYWAISGIVSAFVGGFLCVVLGVFWGVRILIKESLIENAKAL